jgi:hypothetical protein
MDEGSAPPPEPPPAAADPHHPRGPLFTFLGNVLLSGPHQTKAMLILPRTIRSPMPPAAPPDPNCGSFLTFATDSPLAAFRQLFERPQSRSPARPKAPRSPVVKTAVKFTSPRSISKRRYVSWDELTDYGMFSWECEERPVYVDDPVTIIRRSSAEIRDMKCDGRAAQRLVELRNGFRQFALPPGVAPGGSAAPIARTGVRSVYRSPLRAVAMPRVKCRHAGLVRVVRERDERIVRFISWVHPALVRMCAEYNRACLVEVATGIDALFGRKGGGKQKKGFQLPKEFVTAVERMIAFLNVGQVSEFAFLAEIEMIPSAVDLAARLEMQTFVEFIEESCVV